MISKYMRKDLRDFRPYHAPKKDYNVKVDANENPYSHSPNVLKKAQEWLQNKDNLTRYPDTDSNDLREKLAHLHNIKKENVICGVGSDQIIDYITKLFIEPGDKILVPNPSFSMYGQYNDLNHGVTIGYELDDDFEYNIEEMIRLCQLEKPKLLFICSPNNPTGNKISCEEMTAILNQVDCPVVIDEAYVEFYEGTMIEQINQYRQLIVLRTFSKAYGAAGLRVGYAIACAEMIEAINICKAPYNLNSFSQAFASFVLEEVDYYTNYVNQLKESKKTLYTGLKDIACIERVYPSVANYILIKVKDLAVADYLEENKILVRAYGKEGRLGNCMRISVGTQEENDFILELLKAY
jgi:histidinol-phosphate aminotransferase